MLSEIEEILKLPDNWDGDGAVQVSRNIGERANRLATDMYQLGFSLPVDIQPNLYGTITLSWYNDRGLCDIEIGETEHSVLVELCGPTQDDTILSFVYRTSANPHLGFIQAILNLLGVKANADQSDGFQLSDERVPSKLDFRI